MMSIPIDCIINKSQKLSNDTYNNIMEYIHHVQNNKHYKTEEQKENIQYYVNSILMIINYYKSNRIIVNKIYLNIYNDLMLKITYMYEQDNINT